jgi:type III secretory pathway component EscS
VLCLTMVICVHYGSTKVGGLLVVISSFQHVNEKTMRLYFKILHLIKTVLNMYILLGFHLHQFYYFRKNASPGQFEAFLNHL